MTEAPLRTGIVGTGAWGTHIAAQFHEHPDATVVALADVSERSRERAGETLTVDATHQYEEFEDMLESESLDALQVSSPHTFHAAQIHHALEDGLHVFCEKPLTIGVDSARRLVEEAADTDRTVMVGYQRHVHPAYLEVKRAIEGGVIEPKLVTAELTQGWFEKVDGTWRVDPRLSGGGQLYDSGSHLVDAICWLLGSRPTHVTAEMVFADEDERIDVQAVLAVRFESGAVASITVSGDAPDVYERIAVRGGGRAVIEGSGWDRRSATVLDAADAELASVAGDLSSYDKVDAFVRAVRNGTEPPATARDAFYTTALTETAYEAVRTGERVAVDTDL
ncbi:Gfo/Idh/MocA family protein [Natronobiforma cellulositropha]|uniref:Gfo/Idh/MocA family protein n=1 Tax=Natronobiforma cellulositropha TaxID=1679076 RepID=UPI0021D59FCD|nr:Gfo/Idh/MocA family oxidoreductase [Natronobiforma cellulositropha]